MDNLSTDQIKRTPAEVLTEFLKAWQAQDFTLLYGLTQLTWQENHPLEFFQQFCKGIQKYTILGVSKPQEAITDVSVKVILPSGIKRKGKIRLICETAPYQADTKGRWGVNPISAIRILT